MASGQRARCSAIHKGHRRIASDIWVGLQVAVEVCIHFSIPIGVENRIAYGNEDLGNLNVEDHEVAGRIGMVSCFGAGGTFFSRFAIFRGRAFRLKSFGEAATKVRGASHVYRGKH